MELLDKILQRVQKPARYTGGELNSVVKDVNEVDIRFAFCFPDVYDVGMSHLGMKILYHQMNARPDTWCERVFAPWEDMEREMRAAGLPLYGLESRDGIDQFDMVGFTLQYELSYTNILNMLELGNIPLLSSERGEGCPFVCAGGPCAYNPEPIADFIDFFVIGEGEEVTAELLDAYKAWKKSGQSREAFLETAAAIPGVYVPRFYDVDYNEDGTLRSVTASHGAPRRVKKRIVKDLDAVYYPDALIVPFTEIVHDRIMLELFRGCIRGCRFCQAGVIYRPVREKSVETLAAQAERLIASTGYEEMSLASLSTSDYTSLERLTDRLLEVSQHRNVNLSLPSLRVDSFSVGLMEKTQKVRKSGLTFAPEAGTQRLRDIINKGVTEEDVLGSVRIALEGGWSNIKLYFMIGLPFETNEDVEGIAALAGKAVALHFAMPREKRAKRFNITVSVSSFVPKPFTPFQWAAQDSLETLREKQRLIGAGVRSSRSISYNWHESGVSHMEAVFSRGDRRLGKALLEARRRSVRFDGWDEFFRYDTWREIFDATGISMAFYANRERGADELLPWDVIDVGVTKQFLQNELKKAQEGQLTPNCRQGCAGCGAAALEGGACRV